MRYELFMIKTRYSVYYIDKEEALNFGKWLKNVFPRGKEENES